MNLDPRTLLFSLILTDALLVLCMLVAVYGQAGNIKRDGMGKWAVAILLETLVWLVADARGTFPDLITIVIAHGLQAASYAMMLAAICEFQQRRAPNWQYFAPVAVTLVMAAILVDDIRGRFIWGSLIFIFQLLFIARALLSGQDIRDVRAWRLLFGGAVMLMVVMSLRVVTALAGHGEIAQITNNAALQPVQVMAFVAVMAASLLGSIGFVLMVKERSDREIMLLAMTDSLTQIPNRRALMEQSEHALARRSGLPLALLMIDVDHFKRINDVHGHPAGDEVLRKVAVRLRERVRGQDMLGRYGGEEFCVIVPDTDISGALRLAESLRETIVSTPFSTECGELSISVSIGIAFCSANVTRALKDVLAEADSALYTAKKTGRNKVICFGIESCLVQPVCGTECRSA
jgi:diguanylate cyclase (GGDEF)-like protein